MIAGDDIKSDNFYLIFDLICSFVIVSVCVEFVAGKDSQSSRMSFWVLIAIVLVSFIAVDAILVFAYCMWRKKKKRQQQQSQ